jgi:hypothetical protein
MAQTMAAGLRARADEDDWMDPDQAGHLLTLADRLESGTATDEDWIEAAEQLSPA